MVTTILRFKDDVDYLEIKKSENGIEIGTGSLGDFQAWSSVELNPDQIKDLILFLKKELDNLDK